MVNYRQIVTSPPGTPTTLINLLCVRGELGMQVLKKHGAAVNCSGRRINVLFDLAFHHYAAYQYPRTSTMCSMPWREIEKTPS